MVVVPLASDAAFCGAVDAWHIFSEHCSEGVTPQCFELKAMQNRSLHWVVVCASLMLEDCSVQGRANQRRKLALAVSSRMLIFRCFVVGCSAT